MGLGSFPEVSLEKARQDASTKRTQLSDFALFYTAVTRIGIDRVFLAMQQFGNLRDIGYIRRRAVNAVNQPRLNVSTDMGLHPKKYWFPFFVWRICGSRLPSSFLVELGA